jgi:hypothetical protein
MMIVLVRDVRRHVEAERRVDMRTVVVLLTVV